MDQYNSDSFVNQRQVSITVNRSRSKLATASVVLGALFFVPTASVFAVLIGLLAMFTIKRDVRKTGLRRARMGVLLGCLFTIVHAYAGIQAFRVYEAFMAGPSDALMVAQGGDVASFVEHFGEPAIQNADAISFVKTMEARYGLFIDAEPVSEAMDWRPNQVSAYTLRFERATVPAEVRFGVELSSLELGLATHLESLRIVDSTRGDLLYPPLDSDVQQMASFGDPDD